MSDAPRPERRSSRRRSFLPARIARLVLPSVPDVLGLLGRQVELTLAGLEAFDAWAQGEAGASERLRALEHAADAARHEVVGAIRQAFTTPVEPEDLFELSERLDAVLNQAKDLVREAEVLAMAPDEAIAEMAHLVLLAARELAAALAALPRPDVATGAADAAITDQRRIEKVYRHAMSVLLDCDDPRELAGRRELYRRAARIGDAVEAVADRVWYAVVKHA